MTRIEPISGSQSQAANSLWGEQLVEELTGFEYEARAQPRTKLTTEIAVRASNGDRRHLPGLFGRGAVRLAQAR